MTAVAAAACRNHPDREAIGICVECRARICSECVTKVDGINYCVACYASLAERGAARKASEDRPTPRWLAHLAAAGLLGLLTLMTWGLLEAAFPGGG
ncbi:MAG TPA: B-box zinc finger protein [Sandaracinaceae bacterium LLY-WYZ-13_1]|nr:B-box zinc finger protein [Sandaracinaceae bacterium LLY-WYZ-13_1]